MSSDYDEQDQAYQDLLEYSKDENDKLRAIIENIAALIHYQAPLKEQDRWLAAMIIGGYYIVEDDDDDEYSIMYRQDLVEDDDDDE